MGKLSAGQVTRSVQTRPKTGHRRFNLTLGLDPLPELCQQAGIDAIDINCTVSGERDLNLSQGWLLFAAPGTRTRGRGAAIRPLRCPISVPLATRLHVGIVSLVRRKTDVFREIALSR